MKRFVYNGPKFDYPELVADTTATGRTYITPYGNAPSVTTILSTLPKPELDAWRERVGIDEANRLTKEATDLGTIMHDSLENNIKGLPYDFGNDKWGDMAKQMARKIQMVAFRNIDEIYGVEVCLHLSNLYAGRTDLIGRYRGQNAVMDYKTSKFVKDEKSIKNYYLQNAAYIIAHEDMFPEMKFDLGLLFIATRPNEEYKKPADLQIVDIDKYKISYYKDMWLSILEDFHSNK